MYAMEDRLVALLGVFARNYRADHPLSVQSLQRRTGVSICILYPSYQSPRTQETIRMVAAAAGDALVEAKVLRKGLSVVRWVERGDAPEVEDAIGRCRTERWCQDCSKFFPDDKFWRPFGRCKPCYNASSASPASKAWLAEVDKAIAKAPKVLRDAWQVARAEPRAVSYKRLAELTKQSEAELRAAWEAAGLPLRPAGRPRKDARDNDSRKITFW